MILTTANQKPVDVDVENRILRQAVLATTGLASDAAIILPSGMMLQKFLRNPVIMDRHDVPGKDGSRPHVTVIANATELNAGDLDLVGSIQFADTEAGRDYAYLYGCNQAHHAFMRAWSIEGMPQESQAVNWATARKLSGDYWDPDLAERIMKKVPSCQVATRFEVKAFAAVAVGADRGALTRASQEGCKTAGLIVARMDQDSSLTDLETLRQQLGAELSAAKEQIARLEKDIQVLRSEGASAAAQDDSEAIRRQVTELLQLYRGIVRKQEGSNT